MTGIWLSMMVVMPVLALCLQGWRGANIDPILFVCNVTNVNLMKLQCSLKMLHGC